MISLHNEPCPICAETQSEVASSTIYPEHGYPGDFTLRRCQKCGLLFNSPRLEGPELANLYGRNYYFFLRPDRREFDRIVGMYQRTLAPIAGQIRDRRILDIGCGRGYFPALLKRLGWDAAAVEISADAADYARQNFGLDVFTGTIEEYAASPNKRQFPVVTAIDVIEHVPSPRAFAQAAADVVEPGGLLILDTPNAAAHNIRVKRLSWQGFNPFHIYLFNPNNLAQLVEQFGFTVEHRFTYHNTPLDQHPEPRARRARDHIISSLRATGLLGPAVRSYFATRKLVARRSNPEPHLVRAVSRVQAEPPYPQTADASAALAATLTGDNLLLLARKRS